MTMNSNVLARIENIRALAKQDAQKIAGSNPSIVSIALAGAWALGIPSPVDVDLILLFENYADISKFSHDNGWGCSDYSLDLHCLSCHQMERHMFKKNSQLRSVKGARFATRKLRSYPGIKKILLKLLRHHVGFLKLREVTPQAQQILIPLVDKDAYLYNLQQEQRIHLAGTLSACEAMLHQTDGFALLLEAFIDDKFTKQQLQPALLNFYGDSKAFLQRAIQCYSGDGARKLLSLHEYIFGNLPIADKNEYNRLTK